MGWLQMDRFVIFIYFRSVLIIYKIFLIYFCRNKIFRAKEPYLICCKTQDKGMYLVFFYLNVAKMQILKPCMQCGQFSTKWIQTLAINVTVGYYNILFLFSVDIETIKMRLIAYFLLKKWNTLLKLANDPDI